MPLAINNRPGTDHGLLARYGEPAFNNPIVRFFAADGRELVPRRQGVWEAGATAERMVAALRASGHAIPAWLELARAELAQEPLERVVFGMHCFWQGQAALGGLEGVLAARPGFLEGGEVVEVRYDPHVLGFSALVRAAQASGCGDRVLTVDEARLDEARALAGDAAGLARKTPSAAKPSDDLHDLRHSALWHLPLTPLQALRVNSALAARADPERFLAPSQLALLGRLQAALRRDSRVLDGLERPAHLESTEDFEAYRRALVARL